MRRIRSQLKREWVVIYDAEAGKVTLPATLPEELAAQWQEAYTSQGHLFQLPQVDAEGHLVDSGEAQEGASSR